MDDLISRQAAIDALGERPYVWTGGDYELGCVNQYDLDKLAIETVPSAHRALDEWCTDCKEYDTERHCCPRFNRVIRETLAEARENAQPDMLGDGTLIVTVPRGTEVGRVLVQEEGTHNGALFYTDPQSDQRWVLVTERLPGYGEDVLLTVGAYCAVGYLSATNDEETDEWYFTGWYHPMSDVTAWMPLPKPWKGEG